MAPMIQPSIAPLRASANKAFTLLELSIVLAVIGLLIGAITIGKDIVHASKIRATLAQIESFNAASAAFETKYSALPGDMAASRATKYSLFTLTGNSNFGDGDGRI